MKKIILCAAAIILLTSLFTNPVYAVRKDLLTANAPTNLTTSFKENKGQIADQDGKPVPFVLFKAGMPGMDLYVTEHGITCVLLKPVKEAVHESRADRKRHEQESKLEYCRADVNLKNATISRAQIEYGDTVEGYFNYYLAHCPKGVLNVHGYSNFTIRNVYPGIDWQWRINGNIAEQDFLVHPGGDVSQICLQYKWAKLRLGEDEHSLTIHTPIGEVREGRSISYNSGKEIDTRYLLNAKNKEVHFAVGDYDHTQTLRIDPPMALVWGTFVAGNGSDGLWASCCDIAGNVYTSGEFTGAAYPTFNPGGGAYFMGTSPGGWDANLCKFGPANDMKWCTLFGGSSSEQCYGAMDVDDLGNLYMSNSTQSTDLPLMNPGGGAYFQNTLSGSQDIFITRFAPNGSLYWSTYFGGFSTGVTFWDGEGSNDLRVKNGKVYLTGMVDNITGFPLMNPGGGAYYQAAVSGTKDAFVAVFDTGGVQKWTTFLGGTNKDEGWGINVDAAGEIYLGGRTMSTDLPTMNPGGGVYFQNTMSGTDEGFYARFSPTYVMQYSTYWGGNGSDCITSIAFSGTDTYIAGSTSSSNLPITNPGGAAYFQATGGLFVNRFNAGFNSSWGTCYGGNYFWGGAGNYNSRSMAIDAAGNVFVVGYTISPTYNPGGGAFFNTTSGAGLFAFNNQNVQLWATCLGSPAGCWSNTVSLNPAGDIYVVGEMQGVGESLLNPGGGAYYNGTAAGGDDGFINRFSSLVSTSLSATLSSSSGCAPCTGTATATPANGTPPYTYSWSNGNTSATATALCAGENYVTISDNASHTIVDSVNIIPGIGPIINLGNDTAVCLPDTLTFDATYSSATYLWNNGATSATISAFASGEYSVTVTSGGCTGVDSIHLTENPKPPASVTANQTVFCSGDSAQICGNTGMSSYLWNTGATTMCISTQLAGNYYVTLTDANGCSAASNHLAITVNTPPPVSVSVNGDTLSAHGATTYQWYLNGNLIPGAIDSTYIAALGGSYIVQVTDSNGCGASSTAVIISEILTPTLSQGEGAIAVYPNPSSGSWQLAVSKELVGSKIEILDAEGRLVLISNIEQRISNIEFSASRGVYLLRIVSKDGYWTRKLIKL